MTILQTERLVLRNWSRDDLDLANQLWGNSKVMTFLDARGGLDPEQVDQRLRTEIENQKTFGMQYWPIFESKSESFVGCCGLRPWLHSPRSATELGFHLIPEQWGKGFAREAAEGVIQHASEHLNLKKLMAAHHPDNINSKNILIGLGFLFVENIYFKPTGVFHPSYELMPKK